MHLDDWLGKEKRKVAVDGAGNMLCMMNANMMGALYTHVLLLRWQFSPVVFCCCLLSQFFPQKNTSQIGLGQLNNPAGT